MFIPIRGLLTVLFVACLAGILPAQQTLFERALALDSLYDRIRAGEPELSREFFTELRGMYPGGAGLTDRAIYEDIVHTNKFLRPKLNLVFSKLSDEKSDYVATADRIQGKIDSLYAEAVRISTAVCRENRETVLLEDACSFGEPIGRFESYPSPLQLASLREDVAVANPELADRLRLIENQVYELDAELDSKQLRTESVVQLSAAAGGGLPFEGGSAVNDRAFSPFVVQPAGPSSLQASVIDGASRWIAERMREELSIAFFDRFETWMEDKRMYALFPSTFNAMGASVTTDYGLMIQIMKSAFQKDLNVLPFSVGNYLRTELNDGPSVSRARQAAEQSYAAWRNNERARWQYNPETGEQEFNFEALLAQDSFTREVTLRRRELARTGEVLNYVLFSIAAIEELSAGRHPSNLLASLSGRVDELFPDAGNVRPALLLLDVLSRSLIRIDPERGTVWLSRDELLGLARDAQLREIYFGLIHQAVRQQLRDRRALLTRERERIVTDSVMTRPGMAEHAERWAAERSAAEEALVEHQLELLGLVSGTPETAVFQLLRRGAIDPSVEATMEELAENMSMHPRLTTFDPVRLAELRDRQETAYATFRDLLTERMAERGGADPTEQLSTVRQALGLYDNYEFSRKYYSSNYEAEMLDYLNRNLLRGIGEVELRRELVEAARDLVAPYVEMYRYVDPFLDELRPLRIQALDNHGKRRVVADSNYVMSQVEADVGALRRIDFDLYRLDEDQRFLDDVLLKKQERFGEILNEFSQFTEQIDNIQAQYRSLRATGSDNLGSPQMIHLMRNSLGVVRQLFDIALPGQPGKLDTIQGISNNILDAYAAVLEQDYDAVVMNVIPIATTLLDVDMRERAERMSGSSVEILESLAADQGIRQRKIQEVFRYGAFLAAVVESENAEDIKRAIGSIALPSGSYSIKRRNFGNISLNANPGLTGGAELLTGSGNRIWAPNFGFTAPIGLAFSWGYAATINDVKYAENAKYRRRVDRSLPMRGNRFLTGHSGSVFFPLLDLGAVVLFRLDGNTESLPEDVGFQQLFSPGIQYAHGFPDLPIALMVGAQVSPRLRKFGDERLDAFRFNLGITVDLPLANFHTRSTEREK